VIDSRQSSSQNHAVWSPFPDGFGEFLGTTTQTI
jgi:hypothetical protein